MFAVAVMSSVCCGILLLYDKPDSAVDVKLMLKLS